MRCADRGSAAIPSLRKTGPEFHNRLFRNNCNADLFVAGVNGNTLYRNLGNGRFTDVTGTAGLAGSKTWAISAGWLDYDNDGWLDLFVSNYVDWNAETEPVCGPPESRFYCHPNAYRGLPDQLFRNNGDGTFTDVSLKSGIGRHTGKGMGVAFAHFDLDGFTDVFVANDSFRSFLFHNQRDGAFREIGLEDGAAIAGMGADFRDFDNDGLPDLVVSGMINDTFLPGPRLRKPRPHFGRRGAVRSRHRPGAEGEQATGRHTAHLRAALPFARPPGRMRADRDPWKRQRKAKPPRV